jgi:hypothetical protein
MNEHSRLVPRALSRAVKLAAASLAIAGLGAVSGCLTRPIEPINPLTTSVVVEQLTQSGVNKIDLVLVVDNSASMADKQAILALAIPDLVVGLVNPKCLDNSSMLPVAMQPTDPTAACPAGSTREFPPVFDIHIGLLSSSLGSFGANGCPDPTSSTPCTNGATDNDHGHLVTRSDQCGQMAPVVTYQNLGFLAWDPKSALTPPGETAIGDPTATPPVPGLTTSLHDLIVGDGQEGCGFESQNEAWYRFLVDPTPYQSIALVNNTVQTTGVDMTLLQQRTDFLRPDSLLAIINVTDETDTSIKEYSQYPLFAETTLHLPLPAPSAPPRARSIRAARRAGRAPPRAARSSRRARSTAPPPPTRPPTRTPRSAPSASSATRRATASSSSTSRAATSPRSPARPSPTATTSRCPTRSTRSSTRPRTRARSAIRAWCSTPPSSACPGSSSPARTRTGRPT